MFDDRRNHNQPLISTPQYETAQYIEQGNAECQDRIKVISDESRKIICIADGAGGTGDGSRAAHRIVRPIKCLRGTSNSAESAPLVHARSS
jgi:hypothetical protein